MGILLFKVCKNEYECTEVLKAKVQVKTYLSAKCFFADGAGYGLALFTDQLDAGI